MKDEYVKAPSKKINNIKTGANDEYVKPPSKENSYTIAGADEYVKPPKKTTNDQVVNKENKKGSNENYRAYIIKGEIKDNGNRKQAEKQINVSEEKPKDSYEHPSYFGTPKVGLRFYFNSYIVISLLYFLIAKGSAIEKIILLIYFVISNYTYSWFAGYNRYKGSMLWLFRPYGTMKFASAASLFMDNRTGTAKKDIFGNYRVKSSRSLFKTFLSFIIILVLTEILKYVVNVLVALASLFMHKSTIRNYNRAVDNNTN